MKKSRAEYQRKWRLNNKDKTKEYARRYHEAHPGYLKQSNRTQYFRNYDYLVQLKEAASCLDCGVSYPHYVMEFDHRPEEIKTNTVAALCRGSRAKLEEEVAKCDIVCANCHSARTYLRRMVELSE